MKSPAERDSSQLRLRLVGLLLAGLMCLLSGCSSEPSTSAAGTATVSTSSVDSGRAELDQLLKRLVAAVDEQDRTAFDDQLSDRDPGFASRARMILDNLLKIGPQTFALTATGKTRNLSERRVKVLGDDAYAAEAKVRWSVPGDRAPSDQHVWLTVLPTADGTGLSWAGAGDGPSDDRPTPLWWLEPIQYDHDQHAAVIAGSSVDLRSWLRRADHAVAAVTERLTGRSQGGAAAADWNKQLVVIVPSNETLLEQMLGVPDGTESALAAVTWPDGSKDSTAPDRVMINPAGIGTGLSADIVLTHETVHVATGSPASPAPTWLIEGLADYIAYDAYPKAQASAAAALLKQVRDSGPPVGLPGEDAFRTSGDDLELAYAEAWTACYEIARQYGVNRLLTFYAAVGRSRTGNVSSAAHGTLGVGQDQLVAGWQDFLRRAATSGSL